MTRGQAIHAMCKACIYDPGCGGGTWKEQVAQCSAYQCPLWSFRPVPRSGPWANAPRDPNAIPAEWRARLRAVWRG